MWLKVTSREYDLVMLTREMVNDEVNTIETSKDEAWLYADIARKKAKWNSVYGDKLQKKLTAHGIKWPAYSKGDEGEFWEPD